MPDLSGHLQAGEGLSVIFNHGMAMDLSMFAAQMDALVARGYHVVSMAHRSLLGNTAAHSLEDLARDTVELADQLGIVRFVAAGMSMGAFTSLRVALDHLDRCEGLIMIDGVAGAYSPPEREGFAAHAASLDQISGGLPREFAEGLATVEFRPATLRNQPELVEAWIERWCATPAAAVASQMRSWSDMDDVTDRLPDIAVPVLLAYGADDAPIPIARLFPMIERLADVTLVKIPDAGHSSNIEQPELVNAAILAFLDRLHRQDHRGY
ncbi:hypothetical protein ASE86_11850 [Sphingomonas sp. Leaf33]|uniref:alpha/beta fold hydrolase n=1 Tax=Sphingomonas sp. Leaf33 TaxID=1736215 RepID=UPI0006F1C91B|nr:alpha/beta fold hydrolase [Sphingomonas sp. Leaf33]KQN19212.1 hypothetical protein ASE86_11850 [Sphingomonas sp. Leaf33]